MNNGKLVRKYFDFLCKNGFKRKVFTKNGDYEIVYRKSTTVIEVDCYLAIIDMSKEITLENCHYAIAVIITANNGKGNILDHYKVFDEESRIKLKSDIEKVKEDDLEKLLDIYSQFIMQNISKLI